MERVYADTSQFLDGLFDNSLKKLESLGGRRLIKVECDPAQDISDYKGMNWGIWVRKAAAFDFSGSGRQHIQLSVSVSERHFSEHPSMQEFNCGQQGITSGEYLDPKEPQLYLNRINRGFTTTDINQGLAFKVSGNMGGEHLYIDGAQTGQFADTEANTQTNLLLGQMDMVVRQFETYSPEGRLKYPELMEGCLDYVMGVMLRTEIVSAYLQSRADSQST